MTDAPTPRAPLAGGTLMPEDLRLLDHLYDLAGSQDDDFVTDLLASFLDSTAESIYALDAALDLRRLGVVARVAHRLKSSFATLDMEAGAEACALLEAEALAGNGVSMSRAAGCVRAQRRLEAARAHRVLQYLQRPRV